MSPDERDRAAEGIADTVASIDRGDLDATDVQRAYLVGALDTLRAVDGRA